MNYPMRYLLAIKLQFIGILLSVSALAQGDYRGLKPSNNVFVYDYADVLTEVAEQNLNRDLVNFKDSTSNVIVVVTHPDFFGDAPYKFATDLGQAWGIADAKKDNGVVIAIKPKVSGQKGEAFIAVGYGLEGAITDARANRIVDGEMIPRFKNNDYYGGINAGIVVLMKLASGEISEYAGPNKKGKKEFPVVAFIFILLIIFSSIGAFGVKVFRYSRLNSIGFWAAWVLLSQASRTHHGTYGRFSGGGGFGGGGGGGFGGFGGGGFGGGGAGGSW
jgi:uncharacterized protein